MELVMDVGLMGYMGEGSKKCKGTGYNLGNKIGGGKSNTEYG